MQPNIVVHAHTSHVCLILGPVAPMAPSTELDLSEEITRYIFVSHTFDEGRGPKESFRGTQPDFDLI